MAETPNSGAAPGLSSEIELLTRPAALGNPSVRTIADRTGRAELSGPRVHATVVTPHGKSSANGQANIALALLKALSRRWKSAACFGLLAAAVVATAVWTQLPPPKPSAAARLLISANPQTVIGQHPDPPLERGTQIALIRSRFVLTAALRPAEVNGLPIIRKLVANGTDELDWLGKNLQVDFPDGPEIIRIALTYEDGEQAKVVVNAVKDAYLTEIHGTSKRNRNEKLLNLNKHAERADTTLKMLRDQAQALSSENATLDDKQFKLQQELAANQVAMIKSQLLKVQGDLLRLKAEEGALRGKAPAAVALPPEVLDGYVAKDPEVLELLAKQDDLETRLRRIRSVAVDADKLDSTKKLNEQLDAMKKNYEQLRVGLRGQYENRFRQKSKADLEAHLMSLKDERESCEQLEKLLRDELSQLDAFIKNNNKKSFDLEPLRIRIKLAESLYERVNGMITNLTLEQDAMPRVVKLEDAYIVPVEETKRKLMMSGAGALGAVGLVCGLVGFLELRRRRVESAEAVTGQLGLAVIGTVPRQLRRIGKSYGRAGRAGWEAMLTESMNSTRTMLLHGHGLSSARVIQVVSPVSGEGKTTLAANLAASLALAGLRTVLVDGDLRSPAAHRRFSVPDNEAGTCEVLRGETMLEAVVRTTPVAGLDFLAAGKWGEDTAQRLASDGPGELFGWLRQNYEFVIVDSSPILPVTDPLLLARHADGVLVSLMQGVSRLPLVEEANRRLATLRVPVLGAVLHGTPGQQYGYGSGYRQSGSARREPSEVTSL